MSHTNAVDADSRGVRVSVNWLSESCFYFKTVLFTVIGSVCM